VNVEWDEHKRRTNVAKHGLDFVDAERVFHSPLLMDIDDRMEYGEVRWLAYGLLDLRVVVIIYTEPDSETVRVISMRKAMSAERDYYEREIGNRLGAG
jgi:uncharacterized DUF497 family protein